jgi:hypothetical protein
MIKLRHKIIRFKSRTLVFSSLDKMLKPHRVMLGDDGYFWIVCPADATKLEKAGYEYAE